MNTKEDKAFVALHRAAKRVMRELNNRIDYATAEKLPVPVFDGIADLHSAIWLANKVRFGKQNGRQR